MYREVSPPFEELFDGAEEHILQMLLKPWSEMKCSDTVLYNKVSKRVRNKKTKDTFCICTNFFLLEYSVYDY